MRLFIQPRDGTIGEVLQDLLLDDVQYDFFYIIVAYAKTSGINRIIPYINTFKQNGGHIKAIVGVDQQNTSSQALRQLLEICEDVYVYHDKNLSTTFHPKTYVIKKDNEKAVLIVGSSNLTAGGLYGNHEFNYIIEFDLTNDEDRVSFESFGQMFDYYSTPSQCSKKLSLDFLTRLIDADLLSDEDTERPKFRSTSGSSATNGGKPIFGTESIPIPPLSRPSQTSATEPPVAVIPIGEEHLPGVHREEQEHGILLWRKHNLPRSDAQDVDPGTNPTGVLKFTQARWEREGRKIEKTTYFRDDIFGNLIWDQIESDPIVFLTRARFNIKILGEDVGQYELQIRHKPSGEARQHNYTTYMSWGSELSRLLGNRVVGRCLSLYAPIERQEEPFYIEID